MLTRFATAAGATSLLFACSASPPVAKAPRSLDSGYLTIRPEVSLSRTATPAVEKRAALDPHADVMAEILAIPPGR